MLGRNDGALKYTEEERAVEEESKDGEDVVAVPGLVGDDGGGVLENMTADASESSLLVLSIQGQIKDIYAKLVSFRDEEMKEWLFGQRGDLEEMLCFALDNEM